MNAATSSTPRAMPEVLHVVPAISRTEAGVWFAARGLSEALASRRRWQVGITGPVRADSEDLIDDLRRRDVRIKSIPTIGPSSIELPLGAARLLANEFPTVMHVHGLWRPASAYISRLSSLRRIPRVVSPHGMLEPWALKRSAWKKRFAAIAYENNTIHGAGVIHALCEAEVGSIRSYGYRGPICVIPNGVELPVARVRQSPAPSSSEPLKLLFLGRIDPKKGLHLLIPALFKALTLHSAAQRWELRIAGFGDEAYEASLREMVARGGLQDRVQFLGPVFGTAKSNLLASADAFVLPSYSEGLPMAILEAAGHEVPVLCTAECNLPEIFSAGAGHKIALNVDGLAKDLAAFFSLEPQDRMRMGEAARALVVARYLWGNVAAQFEAVYAWLSQTASRPASVLLD